MVGVGRSADDGARAEPGSLCSQREVRRRLAAAGLRPRHGLGQNFLCHRGVLDAVVAAAELTPDDAVLEIGAGLGTLTVELAARAGEVVAVEFDRRLVPLLGEELARHRADNVRLVAGDIMTLDDDALDLPTRPGPFKVVANLPYYLTSPLIERVVDRWRGASLAVLMVQAEVARRLVAKPGGRDYGSSTVFVGYFAAAEVVRTVPASAFWPRPGVNSAVLRLRRHDRPVVDADQAILGRVLRAAFGQRRKQLRNSLTAPPLGLSRAAVDSVLAAAGIEPRRRAEELDLAEFARLARAVAGPDRGMEQ